MGATAKSTYGFTDRLQKMCFKFVTENKIGLAEKLSKKVSKKGLGLLD